MTVRVRPHRGGATRRVRAGAACALLFGAASVGVQRARAAADAADPPGARGAGPVRVSGRGPGGLTVTAVAGSRVVGRGALERLTVDAGDPAARGALGYVVVFGDGGRSSTASPQLCLAAPRPVHRTWHLTHRYARRGTYVVRVTVQAVCSAGSAVVRLRLSVR